MNKDTPASRPPGAVSARSVAAGGARSRLAVHHEVPSMRSRDSRRARPAQSG